MANNRMLLVYRPTGDSVYLGKRMASGWYGVPRSVRDDITILFEKAQEAWEKGLGSCDDFAIAMEVCENQPHCINDWKYTTDKERIEIAETVPFGKPESI